MNTRSKRWDDYPQLFHTIAPEKLGVKATSMAIRGASIPLESAHLTAAKIRGRVGMALVLGSWHAPYKSGCCVGRSSDLSRWTGRTRPFLLYIKNIYGLPLYLYYIIFFKSCQEKHYQIFKRPVAPNF